MKYASILIGSNNYKLVSSNVYNRMYGIFSLFLNQIISRFLITELMSTDDFKI